VEFDRHGTSGFTPDSYFGRGAAEGADVGLDPGEGEALVVETEIALLGWDGWGGGEAED
jgi:hypothetical protein